jgi:hypothetical protein
VGRRLLHPLRHQSLLLLRVRNTVFPDCVLDRLGFIWRFDVTDKLGWCGANARNSPTMQLLLLARASACGRPALKMNWEDFRNLHKRPPRPALGRGRVQRSVRRAYLALNATELSTTVLLDWAYPRRRPGFLACGLYRSLYRACALYCVRVGRAPTAGRPWLWRLRNSGENEAK